MEIILNGNLISGDSDGLARYLDERMERNCYGDSIIATSDDIKELNKKLKHKIGGSKAFNCPHVFCPEGVAQHIEKMKKARFVENHLLQTLHSANDKITGCKFVDENDNEFVVVTMINGCQYKIDVSADSLMAIAADVCKYMTYK